jgi:hypothetical protein
MALTHGLTVEVNKMALDFSGFIPFQRGNMDNQFGDRALDLWNTLKGRLGMEDNPAPMPTAPTATPAQSQPSSPASAKDYVLEQFGGKMQNYNDWWNGLQGDKPTNWEQAKAKLNSNTWQDTSSWSNPSGEPTKSYGKSEPDNLLAAAMPSNGKSEFYNKHLGSTGKQIYDYVAGLGTNEAGAEMIANIDTEALKQTAKDMGQMGVNAVKQAYSPGGSAYRFGEGVLDAYGNIVQGIQNEVTPTARSINRFLAPDAEMPPLVKRMRQQQANALRDTPLDVALGNYKSMRGGSQFGMMRDDPGMIGPPYSNMQNDFPPEMQQQAMSQYAGQPAMLGPFQEAYNGQQARQQYATELVNDGRLISPQQAYAESLISDGRLITPVDAVMRQEAQVRTPIRGRRLISDKQNLAQEDWRQSGSESYRSLAKDAIDTFGPEYAKELINSMTYMNNLYSE